MFKTGQLSSRALIPRAPTLPQLSTFCCSGQTGGCGAPCARARSRDRRNAQNASAVESCCGTRCGLAARTIGAAGKWQPLFFLPLVSPSRCPLIVAEGALRAGAPGPRRARKLAVHTEAAHLSQAEASSTGDNLADHKFVAN